MKSEIRVNEIQIAGSVDPNAQRTSAQRRVPVLGATQFVSNLDNAGRIASLEVASVDATANCACVEVVLVHHQRTWAHQGALAQVRGLRQHIVRRQLASKGFDQWKAI